MILFVSGRTDVLTYYPKWFLNRIKEGFIDTRNPYFPKQVSRIYFKNVDMIVFCSKNPHPFFQYLDEIDQLLPTTPLVFHITITPYNKDIEPVIAPLKREIIEDVKYLSSRYGKNRIFIRYDPIIKNKHYTISYHIKAFKKLFSLVKDYTSNIVISFVDKYKNTLKNDKEMQIEDLTDEDYKTIGGSFSNIVKGSDVKIFTCGEKENLMEYGFNKGSCVTKEYVGEILKEYGENISTKKQTFRKHNNTYCDCIKMVDIGAYNCCLSFCKYCYANYDENKAKFYSTKHNDNSSLLIGELEEDDIIKERIN